MKSQKAVVERDVAVIAERNAALMNDNEAMKARMQRVLHGWVLGVGFWVECEGFVVEFEDSM